MTALTGVHPDREDAKSATVALLQGPVLAVTAGTALGALLTLPKALQVARTGVFLNPDDAMRAVETRDFLNGQGWFDLVAHRLSPDHPFVMHWSRLWDVPLAGLVRLFGIITPDAAQAELAMRLAAPALLFVLCLAVVADLARKLMGPAAMLPAALLLAGSTEFVGNFIPGTIHHHAIQNTLLLGATKLLIDALDEAYRPARAAWAGLLAALSLGIGLQNLPYVAGLAAAVVLTWAIVGETRARALRGFGFGLAATAAAVFVLDVPPSRYAEGACDAFSAAHLIAALVGGSLFVALSAVKAKRASVRLALAVGAGSATLLAVAASFPACLHDPMSTVDPVLRTKWLADVGEALPLWRLIAREPPAGLALLLTLLIGVGAMAAAAWATPARRPAWLTLLLLCVIGLAGTLWQVRVAASAGALMVPGVTWAVLSLYCRLATNPRRPALLVATVAAVIGNGVGLQGVAVAFERYKPVRQAAASIRPATNPALCFEPAALHTLRALPPGLVLSTIDPGSAILAETPHTVLAAPYHRNSYGNRVALLAFDATPDDAKPMVLDAKATYVAVCTASNETAESADRNPGSLAARLLDGHPPDWLTPVSPAGDLYRIYRVDDWSLRQD